MDGLTGAVGATGMAATSRKRPRSSTPTQGTPAQPNKAGHGEGLLATRLLDPVRRNSALNELLQSTSSNYLLDGDAVLDALSAIVYDCLDWDQDDEIDGKRKPNFRPDQAWTRPPTQQSHTWALHCANRLSNRDQLMDAEQLRCMETVITVIRNLSFAAANARLLAFSPDILAILVGCLYEGTFSSSPASGEDSSGSTAAGNSSVATPALHALLNLAPYLDLTGQKIFCDKLFFAPKTDEGPLVPEPSSFGQVADGVWGFGSHYLAKRLDAKEDVITDITKSALLELTNSTDLMVQMWSIFPALTFQFEDPKSPRSVLMMAVDLIQEFLSHARVDGEGEKDNDEEDLPSAKAILINVPDSVLRRLIDLLYVPRLGPDSLQYEDPTINIVTRVSTLKLMMGYDATIDTDVRDRALDVLVPLMELDSPRMAARIGTNNRGLVNLRLYDALLPILAGQVGRSDSSLLATQMLKALTKANNDNSRLGLVYIQERLVEMASRDAHISQLVFSHLYPVRSNTAETYLSNEQEDTI